MLKKLIRNIIGRGNFLRIKNLFNPITINTIVIDISASCNAQCPFCPRVFMLQERSSGFMSIELFEKILHDAKKNNIKKLKLYSTAEPTMHPKFDKIIDIAKGLNFEIVLSTNASLLHKHFDSIMKIDRLQYSIEGWDKESYEKYRFPLKYERTLNNIKEFYEYTLTQSQKPLISTNLLLTRETNIKQWVETWGKYVGNIRVHFMYNPIKYDGNKFKEMNLDTQKEYFVLNPRIKDVYCEYPFEVLTVAFDGKVALCCSDFSAELDIGNLSQISIREAFHSKLMKNAREQFYKQKLELCKECTRFAEPKKEDIDFVKEQIGKIDMIHQNRIQFAH
jgi:MoaA/NifB/PqqE/SkfB family radical SAM enzyme